MDNNQFGSTTQSQNDTAGDGIFSNKNFIITILVGLLVLSFLGINLLNISGNIFQTIIDIFGPLVTQILSVFGYTAGTVIDKTADVATDVAKTGIDIAGGTIRSVGGLLKNASKDGVDAKAKNQLDKSMNLMDTPASVPTTEIAKPDVAANPIQNPITSGKSSWCLVGEYQGRRGCIEIGDQDKCLSGQVFPEQKMCLNPTLSNNMQHPLKSVKTH